MNTRISDAAVEAALSAMVSKNRSMADVMDCAGDMEAPMMRAALDAAMPHLQPAKPEAVRLRDELREAVAAADGNLHGAIDHWQDRALKAEAALAATGKQQVGEVQRDALVGDEMLQAFKAALLRAQLPGKPRTYFLKDSELPSILREIIAARQPVGHSVMQVGGRGTAYDPPNSHRAFTYEDQPGNEVAWRLGEATRLAMHAATGDCIDRGLLLLKGLQNSGFGVFQIGTTADLHAQAVDLGQFRECVELMEWQERGHANPDFPVGDPKKHAEALRLLALIDGQAVQSIEYGECNCANGRAEHMETCASRKAVQP